MYDIFEIIKDRYTAEDLISELAIDMDTLLEYLEDYFVTDDQGIAFVDSIREEFIIDED